MNQSIPSLRRDLARLALLGLAVAGCEPASPRLETDELRGANTAVQAERLPPAYRNSQDKINDPRLLELAEQLQGLGTQAAGRGKPGAAFRPGRGIAPDPDGAALRRGGFSARAAAAGDPHDGPRLGCAKPDEKEATVAAAFGELAGRLDALKLDPSPRPTLTIQMPSGLVLGWINDLGRGRKNLHGEEQ